jgi:hypothetical protein
MPGLPSPPCAELIPFKALESSHQNSRSSCGQSFNSISRSKRSFSWIRLSASFRCRSLSNCWQQNVLTFWLSGRALPRRRLSSANRSPPVPPGAASSGRFNKTSPDPPNERAETVAPMKPCTLSPKSEGRITKCCALKLPLSPTATYFLHFHVLR